MNLKSIQLALQFPGGQTIEPNPNIPGLGSLKPEFKDLASFISPLLNIVFYVAVFLAFFYFVWGAWAYIFASGNKENLAKARARIMWALIGLMVVFSAFFIAKFASEILTPKGGLPF
ncbi:hypothetical protein HYW41_00690 [Candidatus Daviesbacteria bacterium]|nr:hypothetical protein [Candidatus Daviesbacteria bacterium]